MTEITGRELGQFKRNFTRVYKSAKTLHESVIKKEFIADFDHTRTMVKAKQKDLEESYKEYESAHKSFIAQDSVDTSKVEEQETECDRYNEQNDEAGRLMLEVLNKVRLLEEEKSKANEDANRSFVSALGTESQVATHIVDNVIPTYLEPDVLSHEATPEEFRIWKNQFESFYKNSGLDKKDQPTKLAVAQKALDKDLWQAITAAGVGSTTEILGDTGLLGTVETIIMENFPLFNRRLAYFEAFQEKQQTMSQFRNNLYQLMKDADLEKMSWEEHHAFRLITACRDRRLLQKFYKLKDPMTLKDVLKTIRDFENELRHGKHAPVESVRVNKVDSFDDSDEGNSVTVMKVTNYKKNKSSKKHNQSEKCYRCNSEEHSPDKCPALKNKVQCNNCRKVGHFAHACKSPKHVDTVSLVNVQGKRAKADSSDKVEVMISKPSDNVNFTLQATPDSGATVTVISASTAKKFGLFKDQKSKRQLQTATGSQVSNDGVVHISLEVGGHKARTSAIISKDLRTDMLISKRDLQNLGILPSNFPAVQHLNCCKETPAKIATVFTKEPEPQDETELIFAIDQELQKSVSERKETEPRTKSVPQDSEKAQNLKGPKNSEGGEKRTRVTSLVPNQSSSFHPIRTRSSQPYISNEHWIDRSFDYFRTIGSGFVLRKNPSRRFPAGREVYYSGT